MATYNITEDPNNKWVKLITINTKYDIDISNDIFNITVKDQLEYFIGSHIKEGSTFELEELFKKDTFPTLEISNNAVKYIKQKCFTCAPYNTDMDYDNRPYVISVKKPIIENQQVDDNTYYIINGSHYFTTTDYIGRARLFDPEEVNRIIIQLEYTTSYRDITKVLSPTYIPCPHCNGTGVINGGPRHPSEGCTHCGGSGRSDQRTMIAGTGKVICTECDGEGHAHTECSHEEMYTEQYVSNVLDYCNSDDDSLIKNGIQFWVDGVNKRTMYIRVVTKGQSTRTPEGYTIWDPAQNKYVDTGYVGFTIANFNITLNKNERLVFNCFLMPTVNMGDPIPYDEEYTVPSAWKEIQPLYPHVLSANIRTDYDWNDDYKGIDNLYVNNTIPKKSSAYYYEQESDDEYGIYWSTNPPSGMESYTTPMYCVKSSAYVTDYLKTGSATDLYLSSGDDIVSACRDFDFNSSSVNSYLINEYSKKRINLSSDFDTIIDGEDQVFLSANGYNIHDGIYCYEITQYIYDSSCSGIIRDNQVKLELEI